MSDAGTLSLTPLDRAELIEIAGVDAVRFAHAQFSSDVAGLAENHWQLGAWLTAQGRVRDVFVVLRTAPDHLLLWLPLGGAAAMRDALARFVFRANVQITLREGWMLCRADGATASSDGARRIELYRSGYLFAQPGSPSRRAWLGPADTSAFDAPALAAWRSADIEANLPWLDAATRDEFVPQALDLDRLDAVRFDKGCYPGQEIAARLHFRGGNKQHVRRLVLSGAAPVTPGLRLDDASGGVGTVLYGVALSADRHAALCVVADNIGDTATLRSRSGHVTETWRDAVF